MLDLLLLPFVGPPPPPADPDEEEEGDRCTCEERGDRSVR